MRRGDLSVVNVNVHKGELSSMRTGDTASYLLHDFFPLDGQTKLDSCGAQA